MTDLTSLALSLAVESYSAVAQPATVVIKETNQKLVRVRKEREVMLPPPAAPVQNAETSLAFLTALQQAGKRQKEVVSYENGQPVATHLVWYFAGDKARLDDEQVAIRNFCGYNYGAPHGVQLDTARTMARKILKPVNATGPTRAEVRSANASLRGYTKGMPSEVAKKLEDLQGRETLAAETMLDLRRAGDEKSLALAKLEEERIEAIRAQIKEITG